MSYELWVLALNAVILLALYGLQGTHVTLTAPAWGFSARDGERPGSLFAERSARVVRNQIEAVAAFAPLVLIGHVLDIHTALTVWGAGLFLGARVLYVPLYLAGIPMVRSVVWTAGFVGCLMVAFAVLTAG